MYSALNYLAAGEMSDGTFLAYIAALAISGLAMIIVAALPLGASTGMRVLNVVLGLAMLGYAFYLFFIFDGGTVHVFYYVFILPVVMIWRTVQGMKAKRAATDAATDAQQPQGFPTPPTAGPGTPAQSAAPTE